MNNIGKKFNMLTVLDRKRENDKTYYYCKCDCGNEKWIMSTKVSNGYTKSCGCLIKTNHHALYDDVANVRFGKLVAMHKTDGRTTDGSIVWKCICDCGNICYKSVSDLRHRNTISCGCNKSEAISNAIRKYCVDGTYVSMIKNKALRKNNTSGVTGVLWDSRRNKWIAEIVFQGVRYRIGRYDDISDAIVARKEAESKTHDAFIEWYESRN